MTTSDDRLFMEIMTDGPTAAVEDPGPTLHESMMVAVARAREQVYDTTLALFSVHPDDYSHARETLGLPYNHLLTQQEYWKGIDLYLSQD